MEPSTEAESGFQAAMQLVDFVAPHELMPMIDGTVFYAATVAIVPRKIEGKRTGAEDSVLRLYGMDPAEMEMECWRAVAQRKRHKAAANARL